MMKWLLALLGLLAVVRAAHAEDKVTYNMSWLPQGSSVGVVVARAQGWFHDDGLDVAIVRGYGGNRTANELDQGQFDVGYVDPMSLILTRVNGGKIKLIGAINTRWPAGICYSPSRFKINSLDDLRGLRMGGGSASPVQSIIPVWLEQNGKPKDFIHMLRLDPAVIDASLIEGRIDLAECWLASNRPALQKQAKTADVDLAWVQYSDYHLDAYGSGFAAREETIAKQPELLRKFLHDSYRGFDFARAQPEQAADMMMQSFPTLDRDIVLQQIKEIGDLIIDPEVASKGLGYLRDDRMRDTLAFVEKAFAVEGKVNLSDLSTNALLN
jgi:NitT/TauT family transport system substrate-binding protein